MPPREIKGAVHVHSTFSDGTGSVPDIIAAGRDAGLDFVILSDHDTTAAKEKYAGRHGGLLLVVGAEISPPRGGHCLALGDVDVAGCRWMPEKHYLHRLRRQKADIYVAHPEGRVKAAFGINLKGWRVWESEHFDGLEIWSYMHDWVDKVTPLNLLSRYLKPERAIRGPDRGVLALWDRLNLRRRVVGIGALDAHAVKMLFGLLTAFRYEYLFRTIRTHALVDDWGGDAALDTAALLAALRTGRAFFSYDMLEEADGFRFQAGEDIEMGDRAGLGGKKTLLVQSPVEADISLVHNGRTVWTRTARRIDFPVEETGVYRIEVALKGRPWIFSNPIYLG